MADELPPLWSRRVLGMRVDATTYDDATRRLLGWAKERESRYVCVANVHMVMEAYDSPAFQLAVNNADLVTPDGMPLVWALRRMGIEGQTRVYGPDLMLHVCDAAHQARIPIGLFGGAPDVLPALSANLKSRFPGLRVTYAWSPPFRPMTEAEDEEAVADIAASEVRVLFVGLGCPKQERWMAAHRGKVQAVMVGVGAAFDFHAGRVRQAPALLQTAGLEWLFRFLIEPRRLWRRYARHNPRFVVFLARQLFSLRHSSR